MKRMMMAFCIALLAPCLAQGEVESVAVTSIAKSNNTFAVNLYAQLSAKNGNLFFSPESILTALAMAYAGASGDTAMQMAHALHFELPQAQLPKAMKEWLNGFQPDTGKKYQLSAANGLWLQKDSVLQYNFVNQVRANYGSELNEVDFRGNAEAARQTINQWVKKQTQDKISDLLVPGAVNDTTRLVLTNAVYFKAAWEKPFSKSATTQDLFYTVPGTSVPARFMHKDSGYEYWRSDDFQAVAIPYANHDLSMVIMLPDAKDGLVAMEKKLSPRLMEKTLGALHFTPGVMLMIPRFKMQTTSNLAETLQAMGIKDAFIPAKADFSGITGKKDLFIDQVAHKTFIDVNEEGTEAAAATSIAMVGSSALYTDSRIIFKADHPFLFLIRDNRSGSVIFMGRIVNPAK